MVSLTLRIDTGAEEVHSQPERHAEGELEGGGCPVGKAGKVDSFTSPLPGWD